MNLLINGTKYEMLDRAQNVAGEEIINDGLNYCRKMIDCKLFGDYVENIVFDGVFAYDSKEINAVSWYQGGTYSIAISFGYFIESYRWFELWKKSSKIDEIFNFRNEVDKDIFFSNCYIWGLMFVLAHEMCHILNGHCLLCKRENKIVETRQQLNLSENLFSQALEYDADFSASRICVGSIINTIDGKLDIAMNLRNFIFVLYNVFLLFARADGHDFDELMKEDFDKYDHPSASVRIEYCLVATMDYLSNYNYYSDLGIIYYQAVSDCISFDKIFLEHKTLKDCLFTYAFTEKGAQHIKLIHNKCRKLMKSLRKYASVPLFEYPLKISIPFWASKDGDFLPNKGVFEKKNS